MTQKTIEIVFRNELTDQLLPLIIYKFFAPAFSDTRTRMKKKERKIQLF